MKIKRIEKPTFFVIGKEGSTNDGDDFVQNLWEDANSHFAEIAVHAKKDEAGNLVGCWGVMTDFLRQFRPWQDGFTKGLYLAGVESNAESVAPEGWTKWEVPSFEYVKIKCEDEMTFQNGIQYLSENGLDLAGAVHDFTDPVSGNNYMLFPIKKL